MTQPGDLGHVSAPIDSALDDSRRTAWHTLDVDAVLVTMEVDAAHGLATSEVEARRRRFGPNALAARDVESRLHAFVRQYADPMQVVLLVASLVGLYPLKELEIGLVLVSLTLFNTVGQITHSGGQPAVPLDQFLLPMALASDAALDEGQLIGDPTEGALVALAAKGGVDVTTTRQAYPRVAQLPFDEAYKLMATVHRMQDDTGREVVRCFVKGAPDQLLARAAMVYDADRGPVPADGEFRSLYQPTMSG